MANRESKKPDGGLGVGLRRALVACAVCGATTGQAEVPRAAYVDALRRSGYADWAMDYLKLELSRSQLNANSRADLEFEVGASLIAAAELTGDFSKRGQMLDEAEAKLKEFVRDHADHARSGEARAELAHADLQRAQLLVLRTQISTPGPETIAMATQARASFQSAIVNYNAACEQLGAEYKKLPVYLPDEQVERRAAKSRLFEKFIEASFQAALAEFYLADSYVTIEWKSEADSPSKAETTKAGRAEWDRQYRAKLESARVRFEKIHNEHRRELVGVYAHLWMARCLAAQGEHRRAMGIFEQLAKHENRELSGLQREVFHFRLISLAARKEYDQVISQGSAWLRERAKFASESSYRGVQWQVAQAYLARAKDGPDEAAKKRDLDEAARLLERLTAVPNSYAALARRLQLKLASDFDREPSVRGLRQTISWAAAKLDAATAQPDPATRLSAVVPVIDAVRAAVAGARSTDGVEAVNEARLTLAYAFLQADRLDEAAVLAESIARFYPKSAAAPGAAAFAVNAYALGYERALQSEANSGRVSSEVNAAKIRALATIASNRWNGSKEAAQTAIVAGRLDLSKGDHAAAIANFDRAAKSGRDPLAVSLAARARWELYKTSRDKIPTDKDAAFPLRTEAIAGLKNASTSFRSAAANLDRDVFLNDLLLAEACLDVTDLASASSALDPLIDAVAAEKLPVDVESQLRIAAVALAIQVAIRNGSLDRCDRLVELIGKQRAGNDSGTVTQVFFALAARMREQLNRLRASGDAVQAEAMSQSFERFLDRLAERTSGQSIQSRVDLAANYLALGKPEKAISLAEKVLGDPAASQTANLPTASLARLVLADAYADAGRFDKARSTIDRLYLENRGAKDIVRRRGAILERQGDFKAAISHWKDCINRMQRLRPRPDEFYEAVDRTIALAEHFQGDDRIRLLRQGRYLANFLLETDAALPAKWKATFQGRIRSIDASDSTK